VKPLRQVILTSGEVVTRTLRGARNVFGPREVLQVRERGFRNHGCQRYEKCLSLAADHEGDCFDFWTCRGCWRASGLWTPYAFRDNLLKRGDIRTPPSKAPRSTCSRHGAPYDRPRGRRCPACREEFGQAAARRHATTRAQAPMCKECDEAPAKIHGLCQTCYHREHKHRRVRGYGFASPFVCAGCDGRGKLPQHGLCEACYEEIERRYQAEKAVRKSEGHRRAWARIKEEGHVSA